MVWFGTGEHRPRVRRVCRGIDDGVHRLGRDVRQVAGEHEDRRVVGRKGVHVRSLQRGGDTGERAAGWVEISDERIESCRDARVAGADRGDARAEDRAERGERSIDEQFAVGAERFEELVATESARAAADKHDGED